tara:strand:- start:28 stop:312 length:285 start_codon:yes stop_codon:yes gene_type:complete
MFAWRVWRYAKASEDWTADDARVLAGFLSSPAGVRLREKFVGHILDTSQTVMMDGAPPFQVGGLHGMKTAWVFIETLAKAGVSPEEDTENDELY